MRKPGRGADRREMRRAPLEAAKKELEQDVPARIEEELRRQMRGATAACADESADFIRLRALGGRWTPASEQAAAPQDRRIVPT
jgi:hypothetical protein